MNDTTIRRLGIGQNVQIEYGTEIKECLILDGNRIGSKACLRRAITECHTIGPPGAERVWTSDKDGKRDHMTQSELVILPCRCSDGKDAINASGY